MHETTPQNTEPVLYPSSFLAEQEHLNEKYTSQSTLSFEVHGSQFGINESEQPEATNAGTDFKLLSSEAPANVTETTASRGKIKLFLGKFASKFAVDIDLTGGIESSTSLQTVNMDPQASAAGFFSGANIMAAEQSKALPADTSWEKYTLMGTKKSATEAAPSVVKDVYHDDVADKAEYTVDAPIAELMNSRGFARRAARFTEQVTDTSRTNEIISVSRTRDAHGTFTESATQTRSSTEHEALSEMQTFLEKAANKLKTSTGDQAKSLLENMTFIGKKEYDEASAGIAEYWRSELRDNPQKQICVLVNKIDPSRVKSDAYLFDNIIKNFGDDELAEFAGRIVTNPADLVAKPEDTDVVLLDDWTISGSQMETASRIFISQNPHLSNRLQIQLVAAGKSRIDSGLAIYRGFGSNEIKNVIPVKAYYLAHGVASLNAPNSGAHITGAHCAVDYDYNNVMSTIAGEIGQDMPAGTNIVRPYRTKGIELDEINRLQRAEPARAGETVRMSALSPDVIAAMEKQFSDKHREL